MLQLQKSKNELFLQTHTHTRLCCRKEENEKTRYYFVYYFSMERIESKVKMAEQFYCVKIILSFVLL